MRDLGRSYSVEFKRRKNIEVSKKMKTKIIEMKVEKRQVQMTAKDPRKTFGEGGYHRLQYRAIRLSEAGLGRTDLATLIQLTLLAMTVSI